MRGRQQPEDKRITKLIKDSKKSTSTSLKLIAESKILGAASLNELNEQGRQLQRTDNQFDQLIHQEETSKKKIRSLKSIFGDLLNKLFPHSYERYHAKKIKKQTPPKRVSSTTNITEQLNKSSVPLDDFNSDTIKEINDTDKDLDQMYLGVRALGQIANRMQAELQNQKPIINRMDTATMVANDNANELNRDLRRLRN